MKNIVINRKYPVSTWLATITISPVIVIIYITCSNLPDFDIVSIIEGPILMITMGAMLSLPTLLVAMLVFHISAWMKSSSNVVRLTTAFIAISGVGITFYLVDSIFPPRNPGTRMLVIQAIYCVTAIISSLYFKPETLTVPKNRL